MKKTRTKKAKKETISVEILNYALGEIYKRLNDIDDQLVALRYKDAGVIDLDKAEELKEMKIGRWKPEMGQAYFIIHSIGGIMCKWEGDEQDEYNYKSGNCYKTEEEAEKAKERMILVQEYKDFCTELNNGVEIDWNNNHQEKINLYYNYFEDIFESQIRESFKTEGTTYCLDSNLLDKALKKFGEEKLKIILGV